MVDLVSYFTKKIFKCPDRVVLKMVKMMHYGLNDKLIKRNGKCLIKGCYTID